MKKINKNDLIKFGLSEDNFGIRGRYYENLTRKYTKKILALKTNEYLFISRKEWPLRTGVPEWLGSRKRMRRSLLKGHFDLVGRIAEKGWVITRIKTGGDLNG